MCDEKSDLPIAWAEREWTVAQEQSLIFALAVLSPVVVVVVAADCDLCQLQL
jgi:hypothetical protein